MLYHIHYTLGINGLIKNVGDIFDNEDGWLQHRDNSIGSDPMLVQPSMTSGDIGGSTQGGGNSTALEVQPLPPHTVPSIHLNE